MAREVREGRPTYVVWVVERSSWGLELFSDRSIFAGPGRTSKTISTSSDRCTSSVQPRPSSIGTTGSRSPLTGTQLACWFFVAEDRAGLTGERLRQRISPKTWTRLLSRSANERLVAIVDADLGGVIERAFLPAFLQLP